MGSKKDIKKLEKELKELTGQSQVYLIEIQKKQKELAKAKGLIFDSLEEIICPHHKDAKMEISRKIEGSYNFLTKKPLNSYECPECKKDDKIYPKINAYDCPACGIVPGDYKKEPYRSSPESWAALAGREGEQYICKICGTHLGEYIWKMS